MLRLAPSGLQHMVQLQPQDLSLVLCFLHHSPLAVRA